MFNFLIKSGYLSFYSKIINFKPNKYCYCNK
nr:MAG TPA: hypothetical protein [Caudoviricetes sp.]